MFEKKFNELVERAIKGEVTVESILEKITKVVDTCVEEIYTKGAIKVDEDMIRTFIDMFEFVKVVDKENMYLQACLWSLVNSVQEGRI